MASSERLCDIPVICKSAFQIDPHRVVYANSSVVRRMENDLWSLFICAGSSRATVINTTRFNVSTMSNSAWQLTDELP